MSPNRWEMPAIWVSSGDPETVNDLTPQYKGQVGMRYTITQPPRSAPGAEAGRSKRYQYIQTDSTMSVAPFVGAVAWWSDKTKYMVTTSPTKLGRGRIAGVFQNAISLGNYGFIQTEGPATVKFVDAPTANPDATGLFVIPLATAGKADCLAAASAATYPVLGLSAGTYDAANAQCVVDLNVPETT